MNVFEEYKRGLMAEGIVRCYEPWTSKEEEELLERFERGVALPEIAKDFERTRGAIRSRLIKLGKIKENHSNRAESDPLETGRCVGSAHEVVPDDERALFEKHWELVEFLIAQGMRRLDVLLPNISGRDQELMIEYMGTRDGKRKKLAEVAKQFNISPERVRQLRLRVHQKILHRILNRQP